MQRLGAPLFSLLICCMDMVPFVPCGPAAFTSGALYGSYVGAWPPPPLLSALSVDSARAYGRVEHSQPAISSAYDIGLYEIRLARLRLVGGIQTTQAGSCALAQGEVVAVG